MNTSTTKGPGEPKGVVMLVWSFRYLTRTILGAPSQGITHLYQSDGGGVSGLGALVGQLPLVTLGTGLDAHPADLSKSDPVSGKKIQAMPMYAMKIQGTPINSNRLFIQRFCFSWAVLNNLLHPKSRPVCVGVMDISTSCKNHEIENHVILGK